MGEWTRGENVRVQPRFDGYEKPNAPRRRCSALRPGHAIGVKGFSSVASASASNLLGRARGDARGAPSAASAEFASDGAERAAGSPDSRASGRFRWLTSAPSALTTCAKS